MAITFIGVFLLVNLIGAVILFYMEGNRKDAEGKKIGDWVYQLLYFLYTIFIFSFLVAFSFFSICSDYELSLDHDFIVLDEMNIHDFVVIDQESYTSATTYFVFPFTNINPDKARVLQQATFCFYYNNTDNDPNVVRIVNDVKEISEYIYLENNTYGKECAHINTSYVTENVLLGLVCLDCAPGNPLSIPEVTTSGLVKEIHITKGNPLSYEIEVQNKAHIFYLETNMCVGFIVKEWYIKIYLLGLSAFILAFGFRWGFKYVSDDYDETFTKL